MIGQRRCRVSKAIDKNFLGLGQLSILLYNNHFSGYFNCVDLDLIILGYILQFIKI